MSKTVHVNPNPNQTYQVQVEVPSQAERKTAGLSLDEQRLQVELQQHGCTPEQIEQGLKKVKAEPGRGVDIIIE